MFKKGKILIFLLICTLGLSTPEVLKAYIHTSGGDSERRESKTVFVFENDVERKYFTDEINTTLAMEEEWVYVLGCEGEKLISTLYIDWGKSEKSVEDIAYINLTGHLVWVWDPYGTGVEGLHWDGYADNGIDVDVLADNANANLLGQYEKVSNNFSWDMLYSHAVYRIVIGYADGTSSFSPYFTLNHENTPFQYSDRVVIYEEEPSQTEIPSESVTPEPSEEPSESESITPEPSEEPSVSVTPEPSEEPSESVTPEPSEEPSESVTPEPSEEPSESVTPEPSEEPSESLMPESSELETDIVEEMNGNDSEPNTDGTYDHDKTDANKNAAIWIASIGILTMGGGGLVYVYRKPIGDFILKRKK